MDGDGSIARVHHEPVRLLGARADNISSIGAKKRARGIVGVDHIACVVIHEDSDGEAVQVPMAFHAGQLCASA